MPIISKYVNSLGLHYRLAVHIASFFLFVPIGLPLPVNSQSSSSDSRAIILLVDKSGSMRDDHRIQYAQEAAKSIARQLNDRDFFGIVAFDEKPTTVVPLERLDQIRMVVDKQIDNLKPDGQTDFRPALVEARRQLTASNAGRKHVILLSDGYSRGSQGQLVDLVLSMRKDLNLRISTIAIGKEADVRTLKRIAVYGHGRFQLVCDVSALPLVLTSHVLNDKTLSPGEDLLERCP